MSKQVVRDEGGSAVVPAGKRAENYPGVSLAYEFVRPSYDWMTNRVTAAESRVLQFLGLSAVVTFGAPVLARAMLPELSLQSPILYAAIGVFVGILACGVAALGWGTIKLPHPGIIWKRYLRKDEWTFKKDMVYQSVDAFDHNGRLVNRMGRFITAMAILFGLEVLLFVLWVVVSSAAI